MIGRGRAARTSWPAPAAPTWTVQIAQKNHRDRQLCRPTVPSKGAVCYVRNTSDSGRLLRANTGYSSSAWRTGQIARSKPLAWASATAFPTSVLRACHLAARLALI
jgi:hypothetical protein